MTWSGSAVIEELVATRDVVRVLLVEDNPGDQILVREMLSDAGEGAVLTPCFTLEQAMEVVRRGLADLVLLDLSLPDANELDGLRALRAAAPEVPVVVLSGLDDEEMALKAVSAGAQDYLIKGRVNADLLSRAMRYAVERQRAERRIARLALNDPLTALPNRVLFADRLDQALARAARSPQRGRKAPRLVLMFIDLDGFKAVNDELGHLAGDELLVEVAERLRHELRGADTVARLGGDEFVVLCEGVAASDGGIGLARRLSERLGEPYALEAGEARVSAAIGVAVADPGREDAGGLLRRADGAMYAAKRSGPGQCALAD